METGDQETVVDQVELLVDLVEARISDLTSAATDAGRIYGAATLRRCDDLIRASLLCIKTGNVEPVGVLTRSLIETWFSGAFVMFGGAEALARLEHERQRNEGVLTSRNSVRAEELHAQRRQELTDAVRDAGIGVGTDGDLEFDRLTVETIAHRLGPLITEATGEPGDAVVMYDVLYRSYSTFDAHGLHPIERHLNLDDVHSIGLRTPTPWMDPYNSLSLSAVLVYLLGRWVFQAFEIPTVDIDPIGERLTRMAADIALIAFAQAPQQVRDVVPPHMRPPHEPT